MMVHGDYPLQCYFRFAPAIFPCAQSILSFDFILMAVKLSLIDAASTRACIVMLLLRAPV